ncbi:MAG: hypothetical protein Q4D87_01920 [Actinomycetaceae bacterium]|nr:hypothetical protein [Actinomycetaceae bacterium]
MTPDAALTFLGNMDLFWLIAAAGGGFIGAAIGANVAFGMTGVFIFLAFGITMATGSDVGFSYLAFGPLFGPHIAFAGSAAAAAYAAKKGELKETGAGRDLNTALAGLGQPDVLVVGAAFGIVGYIINNLIALIPWFGSNTDTVALTVVIQGIITRIAFGKTAPFAWASELTGDKHWIPWQEKPKQWVTIGLFGGLLGAGISLMVYYYAASGLDADTAGILFANAKTLPFAFSALTIFLLSWGVTVPVTHHITIIGGLAGVTFFEAMGGNGVLALLLGAVFGLMSAAIGELGNRACYAPGDTHIDPPAFAIWPSTTIVLVLGSLIA